MDKLKPAIAIITIQLCLLGLIWVGNHLNNRPKAKYIKVEFTNTVIEDKKVLNETDEYYEVGFNSYYHKIYKDGRRTGPLFHTFHYQDTKLYTDYGVSMHDRWMRIAEERKCVVPELWK